MTEAFNIGPETGARRAARSGKYLTFVLKDEEYGIEILKVREIIGVMEITTVPRAPDYVTGVINLRGKIIPVIDLRRKFGLKTADRTAETCIIVVEVTLDAEGVLMGILVDTVSEVLDIAADHIEPPPQFGGQVHLEYILGMGKVKDKVKILLDIDRVMGAEELGLIREIAA